MTNFSGGQNSDIALQYIGNGQWQPLNQSQIAAGAVGSSQLATNLTVNGTLTAAAFTGNGSGLTNLTGYVAKAGDTMTGTLNLPANGLVAGGSQLVLTNGNVGIGTTSPDQALQVNGNIHVNTGNRVQADTYNNAANTANIIYRTGTSTIVGTSITAQDNGNVGIGTTSPGTTLEVAGTASGQLDSLLLRNTSTAQSDSVALSFVNQYANTPLAKIRGYVGAIGDNGGGIDFQIRDGQTGTYTTAMSIIDSSFPGIGTANIGIGTTNPATTLDVNGSATVRGTINAVGGLVIQNVTADPTNPVPGQIWLRTDLP